MGSLDLDSINQILFWIFAYLMAWNAYILFFNRGVPNIKTAPAIRKKVIEIFHEERSKIGAEAAFQIIDLGAGNGDFSREIAKNLPKAQIVGLEISRLSYKRAQLINRLKPLGNLSFQRCDFMEFDFREAGAVYMFLLDSMMPQIRDQLWERLPKGCLVLSNKFPLGGPWEPESIIDVKTLAPHQKTLYIYRR